MITLFLDGREVEEEVPQVMIPDVSNIHVARLDAYGRTLARIDLDACRAVGINDSMFTRIIAVSPQLFVYMEKIYDMLIQMGFDGVPHFREVASLMNYVESASQIHASSKSLAPLAGEETTP